MSQTTERLRTQAQSLRRKPTPLADLVPLLLKAADDLDGKDALLRMAMEAMLNLRKGAVAVWALGGSHETEQSIASIEAELSQSPAPVAVQPSQWQDIATAPKDGTWVLLCGGKTDENLLSPYDDESDRNRPVVAFWDEEERYWMFSFWDSGWRSGYDKPSHWQALPSAPLSASPEDKK